MMNSDRGIVGFGAYVPRLRVDRKQIIEAHRWLNPGLASLARSERSACGFDEDAVTMAIDAARDCIADTDRSAITSLYLASTTAPFADRLNAAIVAGALGLSDSVRAQDTSGSLRAGTTGLLAAFDAVAARQGVALCVGSDSRKAAVGTSQELTMGHAAASVLVGEGPGVARLLGSASLTVDFVDHYRAWDSEFDYHWEERWVREEGYLKLIPELIARVLTDAEVKVDEINHLCVPVSMPRVDSTVATMAGLPPETVGDNLFAGCGDSGAAHSLLMLVHTLETAKPGEKILIIGFGQGGDALLFEVTDAIEEYRRLGHGVTKWLARRTSLDYFRYLANSGLLKIDWGMRAETDKPTAQTAAYRHLDLLLGLVGGRCLNCGTNQIPMSTICVNPECGASDTQVPEPFSDKKGTVASWSADSLTFSPNPPAYYGMVDFAGGGRLLMDFTNVDEGGVAVGLPMRMVLRIKDYDKHRRFTRYFWKAAPLEEKEG
jgi:hydroxymethylglutaryl-CoA synthase